MTIEKMQAELKVLDDQIAELSTKRDAVRNAIANAQAEFKVGDRVTYEGATAAWEIAEIQPGYSFSNEPRYLCAKIKKDGTPAALKSRLYVPWKKKLVLFQTE